MKLNEIQKQFIENKLKKLSKSKFRSSFHLRNYMVEYIDEKGIEEIENHCEKRIEQSLAGKNIRNDGKQTPMKGHPMFIAQHATATCCRSCMEKWYKIPRERELTEKEKKFVKALLITWIEREYRKKKEGYL